MFIKSLAAAALSVAFAFVSPGLASAKSLGASPSEFKTIVYEGDVIRETIILSKSEREDELVFSVSQEGDFAVDLLGQSRLVIPAGENFAELDFDISAAGLAVGEYAAKIKFVMDAVTQPSGQNIIYGLNVKVHLSVQTRPDPTVALDVASYPLLAREFLLDHAAVTTTSIQNGRRVRVEWDLKNNGMNPLFGIESRIVVSKDGNIANPQSPALSGVIPSGMSSLQHYEFNLMEPAPSGRYDVIVTSGDQETKTTVWVLQPVLRQRLMIALGATLAIVGVAAYGIIARGKIFLKRKKYRA